MEISSLSIMKKSFLTLFLALETKYHILNEWVSVSFSFHEI